MKKVTKIIASILISSFYPLVAHASNIEDPSSAMESVQKAENYIKKNGIKKAITEFKDSKTIFIANYDGMYFVCPLHPSLIGKNQFNYKDPSGALVVQEEINKAKTGGGWLKGRWRQNPLTGQYQCRRVYIQPVGNNYFIGSWYHYSSTKKESCLL